MGTNHHLAAGVHVGPMAADGSRAVCHDRQMAVRAAPAVPERRSRRGASARRRTTLFRRLFLTYAGVVGLAVAVLVLAPITVSVPTAITELAVILAGFCLLYTSPSPRDRS